MGNGEKDLNRAMETLQAEVPEATFSHQGQMVFQMQLAKSPDTVPITRDYLGATEVAGGEQRFR